MQPLINIGFDVHGEEQLNLQKIKHELSSLVTVITFSIHDSDTEPTFVAKIARPLTKHEVYYLATQLHQNAIAQTTDEEGHTGFLAGPRTYLYGKYNPQFFVMLDGKRANEVLHTN